MTAYNRKVPKSKNPKIDEYIGKNINLIKQPYIITDPTLYEKLNPTWSFKRISKETKWVFSPTNLLEKEDESISSKCILARLASFETMNWYEIKRQTHDKSGKSSNHIIEDFSKLCKEARQRLNKLDIHENLFSLRLENMKRIFGVLEGSTLEILWYDDKHEIYPVEY